MSDEFEVIDGKQTSWEGLWWHPEYNGYSSATISLSKLRKFKGNVRLYVRKNKFFNKGENKRPNYCFCLKDSKSEVFSLLEIQDEKESCYEDREYCTSNENMNDLISKQMAINALEGIGVNEPNADRGCLILSGVGESLAVIEALPIVQPEPKWIPCSERFPEYNESVLTWDGYVFCIEKRIPYIRDDDGEPIEGDWWVGDEYDEYESECYPNLRDGAAIAWMPLPAPYKGGDSE